MLNLISDRSAIKQPTTHILSLFHRRASCGETTLGLSVPSPQVLHLCHLVGLDTTQGGSTVFRCSSCQVERVLSLSMRHTCMQCCQLCQGNQCGCGGETNTSIFSASAWWVLYVCRENSPCFQLLQAKYM